MHARCYRRSPLGAFTLALTLLLAFTGTAQAFDADEASRAERAPSSRRSKARGNKTLGRQGAPEDIAGAVIYLARDAQYVTGQIIAVDGGRSLGW